MLKKLLKYDLLGMFMFLFIFYGLAIFFALFTRIFFSFDNSFILNIFGQIATGATISMIASILINCLMRTWVKFKKNLYGDESYLTHTLPVKKSTIYTSKIITAVLSLFISIVMIGLTLFVAYYSKENIAFLKKLLLPIADLYDSTIVLFLLAILLVFFLEMANLLQVGFTGIILGHKMNNNKTGMSVIFGFISYMIIQLFTLLVMFIVALFNQDIMNLFVTNEIINIDMIKVILYMAIGIYTISFIGGYFINIRLLNKGVNVD